MDWEQISKLPESFQQAIIVAVAIAVFCLVLIYGFTRLGLHKITATTNNGTNKIKYLTEKYEKMLNDKDIVWETKLEDALAERDKQHAATTKTNNEAMQADFARQITAMKEEQEERDNNREKAHTERLQTINQNFATLQSQQAIQAEKNQTALENETALRKASDEENTVLHDAIENLNNRIDGLEADLKEAIRANKELHKINQEKSDSEDNLRKIIDGLKKEIFSLQTKVELLQAENSGIVKLESSIGAKLEELIQLIRDEKSKSIS